MANIKFFAPCDSPAYLTIKFYIRSNLIFSYLSQNNKSLAINKTFVVLCARRRTFLTGESPESARQWEGYS